MKTIGLIAGMSWQSSLEYYRLINEMVNEKLGGLHSAKILMRSIDFAEIEDCQRTGDWEEASYILAQAGQDLQCCGAEILLLCTNTMHKVVPNINKIASMPLLHIADATANKVIANKFSKVGLLGTKFTMEEDFYKDRLRLRGLEVIVPEASDRYFINKVIFVVVKVKNTLFGQLFVIFKIINVSNFGVIHTPQLEIVRLIKMMHVCIIPSLVDRADKFWGNQCIDSKIHCLPFKTKIIPPEKVCVLF